MPVFVLVLAACQPPLQKNWDIIRQDNGTLSGTWSATVYDLDPPGQGNIFQGRERIWSGIDDVCNDEDSAGPNGYPGAGYAGYGGYSPPTSDCIDDVIADFQDEDEGAFICTDAEIERDCVTDQNDNNTANDVWAVDEDFTTWWREKFSSSHRDNVELLIEATRDFYSVTITDPSLPSNQATGAPGCIAVTDHQQTDMYNQHVTLRRLC